MGQGRVAPAASQKAGASQAGEGSTGTLMGCARKGVPTAAKTQGLSSDLLLQEGQGGIFLLLLCSPGRAKQVEGSAKLPLLVPRGVLLLFHTAATGAVRGWLVSGSGDPGFFF